MKPRASRRTQKRRQTSRRQARATNAGLVQEITGVLLVALGVWLYFSLSRLGGGQIGDWFVDLLANLFGLLRWVVPGGLIGLGFYLIVIRRRPIAAGRLWGLLLLFFAASSAFHFHHHPSVMFAPNNLPRGGGYLGALLAYPLTLGLGEAGRWVFVVAAGLIGCLLVTQGSLGAFLQAGGERAVRRGRSFADLLRDFWALLTRRPDGEEPGPAHRRRSGLPPEYQAEVSGPRLSPPAAQPSLWGAAAEPWGGQPAHAEPIVRGAGVDPEPPEVSPAQGPLPDPAVVEAEATAPATVEPDHPEEPSATASQAAAQAEATREGGEGAAGPVAEGASPAPAAGPAPQPRPYQLPPVKLLGPGSRKNQGDSHKEVLARSQLLERTLATFGVEAKVLEVHVGPAITRFELQPAPGVKVSRIVNLADDLALNLAATDVRIEAPIPGKAAVGIEVPNNERAAVLLRDVVESREFQESPAKLPIALGKDIAGRPVVGALEKMPHLLIAGATGSGKSVCMNTIILSILMKAKPDEVKMLMVDPKMVELSMYNGIPHLAAPVCTDPRKAAGYLKWAVKEMENRYELFAAAGVRDLTRYNELVARDPGPDPDNPRQPLPYIVILIDELADLMMVAPGEVEDAICRLAQMARACGMHLVIATQRPSVDVITGLIKANIPSRIAFAVSSQVDSRTILDMGGAEKLLGRGDMLYYPVGKSKPERAQGAFIDEKEVEAVVQFVEAQGKPEFQAEALEVETKGNGGAAAGDGGFDPALAEAVRIIIEEERASVSVLQRRLRVNYTKAARLIDDMFEQGWIGPHNGPRPREVYITMPQWQEIFGGGSDEVAAAEEG